MHVPAIAATGHSKKPRIIRPAPDGGRNDACNSRMKRIDQYIEFVRHDHGRHCQQRRAPAGTPSIAGHPACQPRRNCIPARRQGREHFALFPYRVRHLDPDEIAVERQRAGSKEAECFKRRQRDVGGAVERRRADAVPSAARDICPGAAQVIGAIRWRFDGDAPKHCRQA